MTTPTTVTKDLCKKLSAELAEAAKVIAAKHGLDIGPGTGGSFTSSSFTAKVRFIVKGENAASAKGEEEDFWKYAHFYGLTPSMLGKKFVTKGEEYRVLGLLSGRRTNVVSILRLHDSSRRVCASSFVLGGRFVEE